MEPLEEIVNDTLGKIDFHKIKEHPNILIAARFWEDDRYQAAKTIYKFMRYIDDMIDDRKSLQAKLSCMEQRIFSDKVNNWIDCLGLDVQHDHFFSEVSDTIQRFRIPLHFFYHFARSMVYDITHDGFNTFDDFIDYTEGASNGPASVFVHLCCLENDKGNYIPYPGNISEIARPCAIFSYLVHIIRDFQKDQLNNLNYFSLDILERNGLHAAMLGNIARGDKIPAGFRNVIREYKAIAGIYKSETERMLKSLEGRLEPRYMLSLNIIFHLYSVLYNRIDSDQGKFTTTELNPLSEEVRESVMECIERFYFSQSSTEFYAKSHRV
jgi:phytoene/squalene synthetase